MRLDGSRARRKDEWFRTAWLASAVRGTIWGKEARSPHELLGWADPSADSTAGWSLEEKLAHLREIMRAKREAREKEQSH